jgi:hypothetical protein
MRIGLSLSRPNTQRASYSVAFTNTSTDSLGTYAEIGDTIGFTTDPVGGTITQRWGSTRGGAEYGTGANPTSFTAGTLHLEVTRDGEVVRRQIAARHAPGAFGTSPSR